MSKGFDEVVKSAFLAGWRSGASGADRDMRKDDWQEWRRRLADGDAGGVGSEVAVASESGSDSEGPKTNARPSSYPRQGGSEAGCYS